MTQKYGTEAIANQSELERWPNTNGEFLITLSHPEFSALCPRSGYPDSGTIVVDYIPDEWLLELKAFKLFINSLRDKNISHEDATNLIADVIFDRLAPKSIRVIGDFMRRGGVKTVITVTRGGDYSFPVYQCNTL